MRRKLAIFFILIAAAGATWLLRPPTAAERAGWLADYDQLKAHTEKAYANLGDRLASRRISPKALDEKTTETLRHAHSRVEARAALQAFVETFDDHHFRARAPYGPLRRFLRRLLGKDRKQERGPIPRIAAGSEACARLGGRDRRHGKLSWEALPGYQPQDADPAEQPFPAGLLPRAPGPPLAILRIGLFSAEGYPQFCAAQWMKYRDALKTDCDEDCRDDFSLKLEFALIARLEAQVKALAAGGADTLLIDLTDNGGGSSVVGPMMRTLTPVKLRAGRYGFIRHPHWVKRFSEAAADFQAELKRGDLTAKQRERLAAALAKAEAGKREAEQGCDLSSLWRQDSFTLPCANIGLTESYIDYAEPGSLDGLESKGHLFNASQYPYHEGAWTGRLFVLTDHGTASASEEFAGQLQDAGAATLLGEKTLGIGCGYTNGGVTLVLPATGLTVRAPDCVRYRRDGRNEADGVTPDVAVDWTEREDGKVRAVNALAALEKATPAVLTAP